MRKWKEITAGDERQKGLRVYVHDITGDIRVIYPKAPKWAQRAAMDIWRDIEEGGPVTKKGTRDIVCGTWAYMIAKRGTRR